MSYPHVIRPEAESDIQEAFRWYEQRRAGLGFEFLDEVKTILDKITENPLRHSEVHRSARRSLVRRFPFAIIYIFEFSKLEVIAVTHVKRNPGFWQRRVRQ